MSTKKNILFLMTDQQRFDALGIRNPLVKTPNLDRLAEEGILFSEAVCNSPMCVPSRYSMMTGVYPSQLGVRHNMQMWPTDEGLPAKPFAQYLKEAGYETACFGKTHWYIGQYDIPQEIAGTVASRRGFDVVHEVQQRSGNQTADTVVFPEACPESAKRLSEDKIVTQRGGEDVAGYAGKTSCVAAEEHPAAWLTGSAIDFVKNRRDGNKPFFVYLSIDLPHPPFLCPKEFEDLYNIGDIPETRLPPPGWILYEHTTPWRYRAAWKELDSLTKRRTTLRYYALCSWADYLFGKMLDTLKEAGLAEDTAIIFASDHGDSMGERYRFSKYSLYEPSVRVPVILAGAAVPQGLRGTIDPRPAELVDILPTLLDLAGEDAPSWLCGGSLLKPPCREGQFSEFHGSGYHEQQYGPKYMWRADGYKLILNMTGKAPNALTRLGDTIGELYDLANDPLEIDNLYMHPDYLELRERMTRDLLMHIAVCWAKYPRGLSTTVV